MAQNNCSCNDYSQQTASTGIVPITTVNASMDGTGAVTLFTASDKGAIIKAIYIKAIQPTIQSMVRFFIQDTNAHIALYKEVPIPPVPMAATTPVPAPQYIMYQMQVMGGIKLQAGCSLLATTQNTQTFNIIIEGSNWSYPETLPTACCNFMQETANVSVCVVNTANPYLDGSHTITPAFAASGSADGTLITAITIKAMGSTHEGAIRIFISKDGTTWYLMQEVYIPQTTQSAYQTSFKHIINPNFWLQKSFQIGITTQNSEPFAITVEGVDLVFPE